MVKKLIQHISALLLMVAVSVTAQAETFKEGVHYIKLGTPLAVSEPGKIEVAELFWYGCPHCFEFEPYIEPWIKTLPDDVRFERVPATFSKVWKTHANAFYAAEALGIGEKLHSDFFNRIHRQNQRLTSTGDLVEFFADYGVTEDQAEKALKSFGVKSKVNQAGARIRGYQALGVPALVVNGKYRIDTSTAGSWTNMLKITEFLIEKERKS
ncbi:thiol:disulfide interchange protein DsbA/DsbL [Oceanospirillum sp.]|uniref:thiol:disulfide interchange protein DsbA/DsbL n=1 Tax=Oceanospirillum sp. TaxID=2021254 RepID=UPI003A8FED77